MEDGFNAGIRYIGITYLWTIPLILGLAAAVWFGFYLNVHYFRRELSQEERAAIYVGAKERPKSKINIETPNHGIVKIDRVDLDGTAAMLYFHNSGTGVLTFLKASWTLISPDGTRMASGSDYIENINGPTTLGPGEKGEAIFQGYQGIRIDSRTATIEFEID